MKKIIVFFAAVVLTTTAFAQFGVRVGGNVSAFSGGVDQKAILGYQVGFLRDWGEWGDRLSIEPGIFLMHKGGKTGDRTYRLNYLQVPVNTKINFYFGDTRVFIGYGIYGSVALWGNHKIDKTKTDFEFGNEVGKIRRIDIGGQMLIGTQLGRLGMNFTYQPGARAIQKNGGVHNTSYMLNFTYLFSDPM